MKWFDLMHPDGYLAEDLEKDYRQYYLKDDIRVATVSMILLCFLLVAFAYNDYILFGFSPLFFLLSGLRTVFLIYFIILLIIFRTKLTPRQYDWNLFIWLISGIALVLIINLTRPAQYTGNIGIDIILIMLVYLAMPIKLSMRATGSLIFTVGDIVIFFVLRQPASLSIVYAAIASLLMANVVGIYASSRLYSSRRSEFETNFIKQREGKMWQTTFDSITDLVSIQDKDFRLARVNKAYADAFNAKPEEFIGKHCYEVVHNSSSPIEGCPHAKVMGDAESHSVEIFEPRINAFLEVSCSPVLDDKGKINGSVHIVKNITERKKTEELLISMALHDSLTGLPNRTLLNDRFNMASAKAIRDKNKLAIMILDLDKFKLINDSFGHKIGDDLLKSVASRLLDSMRKSDTVARLGGDEFAIMLIDVNSGADVTASADKILEAFSIAFDLNGQKINVTTSIGASIFPDDGDDLETLIKNADTAMYQAKENGRNDFKLFLAESKS